MVDRAFLQGLAAVRAAGFPAKGNDIAVLAAHAIFTKRACGKEHDPRFAVEGPMYAKQLILETFGAWLGKTR